MDYGRSLSLYPLDNSGKRLKTASGQDIIVVLRHLKLSSDLSAIEDGLRDHAGIVPAGATLGYTYWADPNRYHAFQNFSLGAFNDVYGRPDSSERIDTYASLTNIQNQTQDNTRVAQNHMPAGAGSHIHFEVRLGHGSDAPFAHPDALLNYSEFLC
jgi:hypothetical protein